MQASMTLWSEISAHLSQITGRAFRCIAHHEVHGGSINRAYLCQGVDQQFFVKTNSANRVSMFAAEAEGLLALAKCCAVRVPEPICWGVADNTSYLVLQYIELGSATGDSARALGFRLAQLHRHTAPQFGWHRDNTIGSTPQHNRWTGSWAAFWSEHRLGHQIELAKEQGHERALIGQLERVCAGVPALLAGHRPAASLLHGDLWGGNVAADTEGQPVILDPAVYYGDREADLAMTELFGGFSPHFYQAYKSEFPVDAGYETRRTLYNLYHVVNHLNLFGGGYARQAGQMAQRLLSELH